MQIKSRMDSLADFWHRRTSSRIKPVYVVLANSTGEVLEWTINKHMANKVAADHEPAAYVLKVSAKLVAD